MVHLLFYEFQSYIHRIPSKCHKFHKNQEIKALKVFNNLEHLKQ